MICSCSKLKVGSTVTEARNWNPHCLEHGLTSEWYTSPEQVKKRTERDERLRDLQRQAAEMRAKRNGG